ncbi:copper resistance protein CopC [Sulfitobacter sp. MF3-043]|uniref:copper resistance protein CopC n=1 Tax=Sulfitobacter sediminivivens TaxID=3252902 RepID=UPI0036DC4A5A
MKQIFLTGMIGFWATGALAHSPLDSTTPAHEATISEVPSEVYLDFKGDIRLTRLTMQHGPHASSDLDLSGHPGFISDYAIPMQGMGSADHVIE